MKRKNKILLVTAVVLVVAVGLWTMKEDKTEDKAEAIIGSEALLPEVKVIDDSTRAQATAGLYRASIESEYVDDKGVLQTSKIDESLIEETQIENYKMPPTAKNQREPEMTNLLKSLLSRTDGSTNEIDDETMRIVEGETFLQWEELFSKWVNGEINEKELEVKWTEIRKLAPSSDLSKPTVLKYNFPYSKSATKMIDSVLKEVEGKGASTAPHIAFIDVFFDKEALEYTLYFAESHVE